MWEHDGTYTFLKPRELGKLSFSNGDQVTCKLTKPHSDFFELKIRDSESLTLHRKALESMVKQGILKKD